MNTHERQERILSRLRESGAVQVRDLVECLGVSEMTVRRDLELLAAQGHLVRTYGGAMPASVLSREVPYADKAGARIDEKERIARAAAALVRDGDLILLDAGSTTAALARALRGRRDLTVMTNDLKVAVELCDEPGVRVMVTGGTAQPSGYNLVGPLAEQTLRGLTVDIAFLGTSAADPEYGLTTPTLEKVPLKQAMIRAGRRVVLLTDSSKFGRRSTFPICSLGELSQIITDTHLPAEMASSIRQGGVKLDLV